MTDAPDDMNAVPTDYPVNLDLVGRGVLVVGAGAVAGDKIDTLLDAGAVVTVVAPSVGDVVREQARSGRVTLAERCFEPDDLAGVWFVVAATGDPEVNRSVRARADALRIFVNAADDPERCTATLPARLRRGSLLVTVSTAGRSPALASWIRRRVETELGPEYGTLVDVVADVRATIRASGRSTEGLDWPSALDAGTLEMVREGNLAEAKEHLLACLS